VLNPSERWLEKGLPAKLIVALDSNFEGAIVSGGVGLEKNKKIEKGAL